MLGKDLVSVVDEMVVRSYLSDVLTEWADRPEHQGFRCERQPEPDLEDVKPTMQVHARVPGSRSESEVFEPRDKHRLGVRHGALEMTLGVAELA